MTSFLISYPDSQETESYKSDPRGSFELTIKSFNGLKTKSLKMKKSTLGDVNWPEPAKALGGSLPVSRESYIKLIAKTIDHIRTAGLGKIVVSRYQDIPIKPNSGEIFFKLVKAYPGAGVYLLSDPDLGTWVGATPEILLKGKENLVYAMSLAGTASAGDQQALGSKEEEEQSMVTDFISQVFEESGLKNIKVSKPHIQSAGNLIHLLSEISAPVPEGYNYQTLLDQLHPTPAVAGLPRKEALEFLNRYESYDRELYAGYFGLRKGDNFTYFVNLRCMQVFSDGIRLYAGGGITADSDAEAEWLETEKKMDTVRSILM